MDIQAEKLDLINWLVTLSDKKVIRDLVELRKSHENVTIVEYDQELEKANAEIETGKFVNPANAVDETQAWREK